MKKVGTIKELVEGKDLGEKKLFVKEAENFIWVMAARAGAVVYDGRSSQHFMNLNRPFTKWMGSEGADMIFLGGLLFLFLSAFVSMVFVNGGNRKSPSFIGSLIYMVLYVIFVGARTKK